MFGAASVAALSVLLPSVLAADQVAGTVKFDLSRREEVKLARRSGGSVTAQLENTVSLYSVDAKIGTPPQVLSFQLDTGSSDTWAPASTSQICEQGSCSDGSFDPSSSSTYNTVLQGGFSTSYGDGTSAQGDYGQDEFSIGGASMSNFTIGVGLTTDIPTGLVGVGFAADEAIAQTNPSDIYPNLPFQMLDQGLINTVAYSLWLNDLDSSTGSILFGGVDTDKYQGALTMVDMYPTTNANTVTEFAVALSSLQAVSSSGADSLGSSLFPFTVILDSGTTVTSLPTDLVNQIYAEVGAELSSNTPYVPCKLANSKAYFSFGFGGAGGAVVNVTLSELVLPGVIGNYSSGPFKGQSACEFGIISAAGTLDDPAIFGDTFLRSAYVVYDLANAQAALANTDFNATASNVVTFASLSAQIPRATPAPSQAAAQLSAVAVTATQTTKLAAQAGMTAAAVSSASDVRPWTGSVMGVVGIVMSLVAAAYL